MCKEKSLFHIQYDYINSLFEKKGKYTSKEVQVSHHKNFYKYLKKYYARNILICY